MTDPQRLRDLAETLDGDDWEHPLGSAALVRDAADEIERLREEVRVLSSPQRLSETLAEFVRMQAVKAAAKGGG